MKSLFLAWQGPNRAWFPVGRLDADVAQHRYCFGYTKGAVQAKDAVGFMPLPAFPEFGRTYESSELFPLFQNRVLDPNRKDFAAYLASLDLPPSSTDPIEILAVSGGERQTDSLEVFPRIQSQSDGAFMCRFFVHGWRHMPEVAQQRAMSLQPGDRLGVSLELTNPAETVAILLATSDYTFVGWTPRYLVTDLLKAISQKPSVTARVVRVNSNEVPANRRVMVELTGTLPPGLQPMSSEEFQPLVAKPATH
jgi:hypothetical protein